MRRSNGWLLLILLLAAALRMINPGIYSVWIDELLTTDAAMQLARHGQWTWIGNPTSFNPIPIHSPFTTYLTAIPLLLAPSWIFARLFVGLFGVLSVGGLYALLRRYSGQSAAIIGSTLLAVTPTAVDLSRFVWNPNYAPPFIVFWLFTGLLGYYEGKRWAQVLHWLLLSAIIQTQTALIIIIPLSFLLLAYHTWDTRKQHTSWLKTNLFIFGIVILTLIPWGIGVFGVQQDRFSPLAQVIPFRSSSLTPQLDIRLLMQQFSLITSSMDFHISSLSHGDNPAQWWPDSRINILLGLQALVIFSGIMWCIKRGLYKREALPGLWFSITTLWSLAYLLLGSNGTIDHFYMMTSIYSAACIFGIVFAHLWQRNKLIGAISIIFIISQLWLSLAMLDKKQQDSVLSLGNLRATLQNWTTEYGEIVIIEENIEENYQSNRTRLIWQLYWNILKEEYPLRSVSHPHAIPIATNGQVLVSTATGTIIPTYFGEGEIFHQDKRDFRYIEITPDDAPQVNFIPDKPHTFGNLLQLSGAMMQTPQSGTVSTIVLIWTPLITQNEQYQFSVRLIDSKGNRYGQSDVETLQPNVWRMGDTVMTQLAMQISDTLPQDAAVHLEILVYSWPDIQNVPLLDSAQNPVGEILTLVQTSD